MEDPKEILDQYNKNHPTYENSGDFYNKMTGDGYDNFVKDIKFTQPQEITKVVGPGQIVDIDPSTSEVLDIGAGTGTVGLCLKEKGFTNITAVDASESLLEKLDKNGAYKASRCLWLGMGLDKFPDELKGKFDMVTAAGVWITGHIPVAGIEDAHAALKTGGYMVSGTRSMYWVNGEKEGYKDKIDEMIAAGKFKLLHVNEWTHGVPG